MAKNHGPADRIWPGDMFLFGELSVSNIFKFEDLYILQISHSLHHSLFLILDLLKLLPAPEDILVYDLEL